MRHRFDQHVVYSRLQIWDIGGQHLQSSAHGIAEGAVALADSSVDSVNLALTKDIFGLGAVSENDEGKI